MSENHKELRKTVKVQKLTEGRMKKELKTTARTVCSLKYHSKTSLNKATTAMEYAEKASTHVKEANTDAKRYEKEKEYTRVINRLEKSKAKSFENKNRM